MFDKIANKLDRLAGLQPSNNNMNNQQTYPAMPQYTTSQPINNVPPPQYGHFQQPQYTQHPNMHPQQPLSYQTQGVIPQYQPQPPPQALPSFRITKDEVRNLLTNQHFLSISRSSAHELSSSKSLLTLTRPNGSVLGTLHFHSLTTGDIDYTTNGRLSRLSDSSYGLSDKPKFKFTSISGQAWVWKMKEGVLVNANGEVLARVEDETLVLQSGGLRNEEYDEILVTAVAIVEKRRRDKKEGKEAEAAGEVISAVFGG